MSGWFRGVFKKEQKSKTQNPNFLPHSAVDKNERISRQSDGNAVASCIDSGFYGPLAVPLAEHDDDHPQSPYHGQDTELDRLHAELAIAWSLAQESYLDETTHNIAEESSVRPPNVTYFGDAVSLPPARQADGATLAVASALADSEFKARQAEELDRVRETLFEAKVTETLKISLQSKDFDNIAREIKLWIGDLCATIEIVTRAEERIQQQQQSVVSQLDLLGSNSKVSKHMESEEHDQNMRRLTSLLEQLDLVECHLHSLAESLNPVSIASIRLEDLYDLLLSQRLQPDDADLELYQILDVMFQDVSSAMHSLNWRDRVPVSLSMSTIDLRNTVTLLIDKASKSLGKTTYDASDEASSSNSFLNTCFTPKIPQDVDPVDRDDISSSGVFKSPKPGKKDKGKMVVYPSSPLPSSAVLRSFISREHSQKDTVVENLRRLPALISLHYELIKDNGVVSKAVQWEEGDGAGDPSSLGSLVKPMKISRPPANANDVAFVNIEDLVSFVDQHHGFIECLPPEILSHERWGMMRVAAFIYLNLQNASLTLSQWETPENALATEECRRLTSFISRTMGPFSLVSYPGSQFRQILSKLNLPWDNSVVSKVRCAAQHATIMIMVYALEASEAAERAKGSWQRQAVLQPLGYAVMAATAAHQLSGGFNAAATSVCELLVEKTIHYARLIDPKWFRGHKVVNN